MKKITEKQLKFCKEYLLTNNATTAAINAGYSEKYAALTASRLLKTESVQFALKSIKQNGADGITNGYVINKLVQLLEKCLEEKPVMKWDSATKTNIETGEYTFDSTGAIKVLEQLSKQLNNAPDKDIEENKVVNIIEDI